MRSAAALSLRLLAAAALTLACSARAAVPRLELAGVRGESAFFVLGMLQEYLGRHVVEGGDLVERFYCDEADRAATFAAALARFAADQGLDPRVERRIQQECLVSFHSRALADAINSFYDIELTDGVQSVGDDGEYHRTGRGFVSSERVAPHGAPAARAYLAGAYARFGDGDRFRFANAQHKAELVATLLREHGGHRIVVETTWDTIPRATTVHFEADEALRALLVAYRPTL